MGWTKTVPITGIPGITEQAKTTSSTRVPWRAHDSILAKSHLTRHHEPKKSWPVRGGCSQSQSCSTLSGKWFATSAFKCRSNNGETGLGTREANADWKHGSTEGTMACASHLNTSLAWLPQNGTHKPCKAQYGQRVCLLSISTGAGGARRRQSPKAFGCRVSEAPTLDCQVRMEPVTTQDPPPMASDHWHWYDRHPQRPPVVSSQEKKTQQKRMVFSNHHSSVDLEAWSYLSKRNFILWHESHCSHHFSLRMIQRTPFTNRP